MGPPQNNQYYRETVLGGVVWGGDSRTKAHVLPPTSNRGQRYASAGYCEKHRKGGGTRTPKEGPKEKKLDLALGNRVGHHKRKAGRN